MCHKRLFCPKEDVPLEPSFLESEQNPSVSKNRRIRANEEIIFFGISENLKSDGIIFVVILSAFLRHGGYSDGANAHIFAQNGNQKIHEMQKKLAFLSIFNEETLVFEWKTFSPLKKGYFLVEKDQKLVQKRSKKRAFFSSRQMCK